MFAELPDYLVEMAKFAVNTGCRDQEVCGLRWEWAVEVPELGTSVFIVPCDRVKNGDERLVVLNSLARAVVERRRGFDADYVFTIGGSRITRIM